jgi:hypothetical protein
MGHEDCPGRIWQCKLANSTTLDCYLLALTAHLDLLHYILRSFNNVFL